MSQLCFWTFLINIIFCRYFSNKNLGKGRNKTFGFAIFCFCTNVKFSRFHLLWRINILYSSLESWRCFSLEDGEFTLAVPFKACKHSFYLFMFQLLMSTAMFYCCCFLTQNVKENVCSIISVWKYFSYTTNENRKKRDINTYLILSQDWCKWNISYPLHSSGTFYGIWSQEEQFKGP